jgi:hypothetical protein
MKSILLVATGIICSLAACTPFKMAVHEDLQPAYDEYSVKGRQGILIKQKMSFGNYGTSTVKRSWTKGTSSRRGIGFVDPERMEWVNIISTEYINRKQTLRYTLSSDSLQSEVFCVSRFKAKDLTVGRRENSILNVGLDIFGPGIESSSMYYVQIYPSDKNERPWELLLDNQESQEKPGKYIGYLTKSKTEYYTLHPVNKLDRKGKQGTMPFGAIGFEFRNAAGKTLAAVSMMDKGMIYLAKTNPAERFLLANACTAILLQQQIE